MANNEIFLNSGGTQRGPFSVAEVQRQVASGECTPSTLAWHEGMADWKPVSSLSELTVVAEEESAAADSAAPIEPGAPPAVPASAPVTHPGVRTGPQTNGLAIASLILGCLSIASLIVIACFAIVLAVPAVIMGHCALSQIRARPGQYEGRGLAIAGLWTGYICIVLCVLLPLLLIGGVAIAPFIFSNFGM